MSKANAVVIGATRNLGLHVARRLAERGWSVVGVGRSTQDLVPLDLRFVAIDLARADAVDALTALLQQVRPTLIVSNAVSYGPAPSHDLDLGAAEAMFRVNALAPFLALSRYLENASGITSVIINSDSMFHANRSVGPYAASKAALKVLTTALADACRSNENSVATLLLGPLADAQKMQSCALIAERNGIPVEDVIKALLKKGNPFYLMESFIQFDSCFRSIEYIHSLGATANGMVCKLDGGASGSLY